MEISKIMPLWLLQQRDPFALFIISSSLPPAVAAAGVAADEEERHPLLTPRSGLQNKMNQSHGEVSLV